MSAADKGAERVADLMRPWEGCERIPIAGLLKPLGLNTDDRRYLYERGVVRMLPERGERNAYLVDQAEARRLAEAATLASYAGTSVSTTLRVLKARAEYFDDAADPIDDIAS